MKTIQVFTFILSLFLLSCSKTNSGKLSAFYEYHLNCSTSDSCFGVKSKPMLSENKVDTAFLSSLFPEIEFIGEISTLTSSHGYVIMNGEFESLDINCFSDSLRFYLTSFFKSDSIEMVGIEQLGDVNNSLVSNVGSSCFIVETNNNSKISGSIFIMNKRGEIFTLDKLDEAFIPSRKHLVKIEKDLYGIEYDSSKVNIYLMNKEKMTLFDDRYISIEYTNNDTFGTASIYDLKENKFLARAYGFYNTCSYNNDTLTYMSPLQLDKDSLNVENVNIEQMVIVDGEFVGTRKGVTRFNSDWTSNIELTPYKRADKYNYPYNHKKHNK